MKKGRANSFQQKRNITRVILFSILCITVIIALYLAYFSPRIQFSPEEEQLQEIMVGSVLAPLTQNRANKEVLCSGTGVITDSRGNEYTGPKIRDALRGFSGATDDVIEAAIDQVCGRSGIHCSGVRGDSDNDGRLIHVTDAQRIINHVNFGQNIDCLDQADFNRDGRITIEDAAGILALLSPPEEKSPTEKELSPVIIQPTPTATASASPTPSATTSASPSASATPKSSASPKPSGSSY